MSKLLSLSFKLFLFLTSWSLSDLAWDLPFQPPPLIPSITWWSPMVIVIFCSWGSWLVRPGLVASKLISLTLFSSSLIHPIIVGSPVFLKYPLNHVTSLHLSLQWLPSDQRVRSIILLRHSWSFITRPRATFPTLLLPICFLETHL